MKNYVKPVVLTSDEVFEGVYAASGMNPDIPGGEENPGGDVPVVPTEPAEPVVTTDCWTVDAVSVQDWNGSHNVFEIRCGHNDSMQHISTNTEVTLTFDHEIVNAYSEFDCSFSGNTVTVNRALHANGYQSGDTMTYKVWVQAADEATTKAITCTFAGISCTHAVNVQGGFD